MPTFDDYGTLKGLAYKHDWQQATDNMLKFEQFKKDQQLQREKKSQYYADRIQRGNTSTEYNSKRLQKYYDGLNKELGEFLVKNPNWEQDMMQVNQFNELTDKYLNNPIMREDLEVQKDLELIRQDRNNMSVDHFTMLMEQYDRYDSQEIGDDPLREDGMKFKYVPESKLDFTGVVKVISDLTGIMDKSYTDENGITKRMTYIPEDKLATAKTMVYSNKEYYSAADLAYKTYIKNSKNNIYSDFDDFLEDAIKNPKDLQDIYQKMSRSNGGGSGLDPNWATPRAAMFLQQLQKSPDGKIKTNEDALAWTEAGKKGGQFDLIRSGAIIIMKDKDGKEITMSASNFPYKSLLGTGFAVTSKEVIHTPESRSTKIRVVVNIPMLTNEDGKVLQGYDELKKSGWNETTGKFSELGFVPSEMINGAKKYLSGEIYMDANLDDPQYWLAYNDITSGRSMDAQKAAEVYVDNSIEGYKMWSDETHNLWVNATNKTEQFKNKNSKSTPENSDPNKEFVLQKGGLNESQLNIAFEQLK